MEARVEEQKQTNLFVFSNGIDTVIASSAEDATAVVRETSGIDDDDPGQWERFDAGRKLTIQHVDEDGCPKETKTCAEWCETGRGLLASTEY